MGVAAYNRGSECIRKGIESELLGDYRHRGLQELMERTEHKNVELEAFVRNVRSLLVDSSDESTAKGLLRHHIFVRRQKKITTKRYASLNACVIEQHNAWVDSDHREVMAHFSVCCSYAQAYLDLISYLNVSFHLPFSIPTCLVLR